MLRPVSSRASQVKYLNPSRGEDSQRPFYVEARARQQYLVLWKLSFLIAREAGDSIKPRVEAKPEPWVSHGKLSQAHEMGDRVWDQPRNFEVYRPLRGLATLVARSPGFRLRLHPGLYVVARFAG
jgi:hypothetical protein